MICPCHRCLVLVLAESEGGGLSYIMSRWKIFTTQTLLVSQSQKRYCSLGVVLRVSQSTDAIVCKFKVWEPHLMIFLAHTIHVCGGIYTHYIYIYYCMYIYILYLWLYIHLYYIYTFILYYIMLYYYYCYYYYYYHYYYIYIYYIIISVYIYKSLSEPTYIEWCMHGIRI